MLDLQIGNMGGIAVTMDLRLEESGDRLPHVPVIVLLDRKADLHLARRSGADGWLVKPLDALRLRERREDGARRGHLDRGSRNAGWCDGDRRVRSPTQQNGL